MWAFIWHHEPLTLDDFEGRNGPHNVYVTKKCIYSVCEIKTSDMDQKNGTKFCHFRGYTLHFRS